MPWDKLPYLCVLATLLAASFGMPIPEDIPLLTGGYLCHRGLAQLPIMLVIAMIGVLTGDFVLYGMGRRFGHHIVEHRFVRRLINPSRLLMAERLFARHGIKIIFAGRFLPGLRSMIFVASGCLKVSPWTFGAVNGFAACISVPTLVLLGYAFGQNIARLEQDVRLVTTILAVAVLGLVLIMVAVYLHRRQRQIARSVGVPDDIDPETLAGIPPEAQLRGDAPAQPAPAARASAEPPQTGPGASSSRSAEPAESRAAG